MTEDQNWHSQLPILDLRDKWASLSEEQRVRSFTRLDQGQSDDFFLSLTAIDQAELLSALPESHRRHWIRLLAPDDLADVVQALPEYRDEVLAALDTPSRKEVCALLAYAEDEAGGLMNSRFARVRPDMRVDEALKYIRKQAEARLETLRYIFVLDQEQRLLGVVSLRALFIAGGDELIRAIMRTNIVTASPDLPQDELSKLFQTSGLMAIPVVDGEKHIIGIVTVDDIVSVVEEEATEDIQRLGGTEELGAPYLKVALPQMIRKRAGWLIVLFMGEMLTATAMGYYEHEISKAIVLALFIPLIISSGGNSGSQASTLVVRAIALGEVRLRDWWRVFLREIVVGFSLGMILGAIGLARILIWPTREALYGEHFLQVGYAVSLSLIGIVLWGSLCGSMLPFLLKKCRFDPATASAPFVATLVDVSGLVIYFTVASLVLSGTLL